MEENIITINIGITFLILFFISSYLLIRYNKDIDGENIIDYFLYLTNKILIFILALSSLFIFIVSVNYTFHDKIINFINATFLNILYFSFVMYSIFYLTKFIYYIIKYVNKNDLFGKSYLDKLNLSKGGKKK